MWVASSTVIAGIPIEASHPSTDLLITTLPLVWVEVAVGGVVYPTVVEGGLVAEKKPVGSKKYAPTPKTSTAAAPAIIILYIEKIVRRI